MARSRSSAKSAGSRHERQTADYLAAYVDDRIDRRVKTGAADKGDIAGVRIHGSQRLVVECKDTSRTELGVWAAEVEKERINDGALVGVVVHKRKGKGAPGEQWVTLTLADLVALITGERPPVSLPDHGEKEEE